MACGKPAAWLCVGGRGIQDFGDLDVEFMLQRAEEGSGFQFICVWSSEHAALDGHHSRFPGRKDKVVREVSLSYHYNLTAGKKNHVHAYKPGSLIKQKPYTMKHNSFQHPTKNRKT